MQSSTKTLRRSLVSRSVVAVFAVQLALFLGAHAATRAGLDTVADFLGIVVDGAIFGLLLVSQLIPWSWVAGVQVNNELFLSSLILLSYLAVYYAAAVVLVAFGRVVYRVTSSGSN